MTTHSSGGADYRSVIDDLSIEIYSLKAELDRYKRIESGIERKGRLFAVEIYDLPQAKRDELEILLQHFVQRRDIPQDTPTLPWEISAQNAGYARGHSMSASVSTNASSSATHVQQSDAAYATMTTGTYPPCAAAELGSTSAHNRPSDQGDVYGAHDVRLSLCTRDRTNDLGKNHSVVQPMDDHHRGGTRTVTQTETGGRASEATDKFRYQPLVFRQETSSQASVPDTSASIGPSHNGPGNFQWGWSALGPSTARKRLHDGRIVYYANAPFFVDMSGNTTTPQLHKAYPSYQSQQDTPSGHSHPCPYRSESGSPLNYRPLSDGPIQSYCQAASSRHGTSNDEPCFLADNAPRSSSPPPNTGPGQCSHIPPLEPSGIGGVLPEDYFTMSVRTKRKEKTKGRSPPVLPDEKNGRRRILKHTGSKRTSGATFLMPKSSYRSGSPIFETEYLSEGIKRLTPLPLPPPALYVSPRDADDSSECGGDSGDVYCGNYGCRDDRKSSDDQWFVASISSSAGEAAE